MSWNKWAQEQGVQLRLPSLQGLSARALSPSINPPPSNPSRSLGNTSHPESARNLALFRD